MKLVFYLFLFFFAFQYLKLIICFVFFLQVVEVIEVYHYTEWEQYDGSNPETGMFTRYINKWLKMKQEASGWPDWCKTEEHKQLYISSYKEHEGIDLDSEAIEKNQGKRTIGKLSMNSFWYVNLLLFIIIICLYHKKKIFTSSGAS